MPDRFVCRRIVATCCAFGLILLTSHEAGRGQEAEKPPVNLTFTNATGGPVEMFWLSLQGERSNGETRQEVGVPPLRWSPVLAAFAQAWADELGQRGTLDHRPREGPSAQKYGENLAVFGANMTGEHQGAGLWTDEKAKYTPGTSFDPNAGAGHYTQMVWRGTTELGAGKAPIHTGPLKGMWILVGNYNPAGNHGAVRTDGTVVWEKPY